MYCLIRLDLVHSNNCIQQQKSVFALVQRGKTSYCRVIERKKGGETSCGQRILDLLKGGFHDCCTAATPGLKQGSCCTKLQAAYRASRTRLLSTSS